MNLYIDIDGVLIHDALDKYGTPVNYAVEFLKEATTKYNCFWLTTHCKDGQNNAPNFLANKLPPEAGEYIEKIKPTNWFVWKTEGIDFSQDFRWIDDDVYGPELATLAQHNCSDKLIFVDLQKNPNILKDLLTKFP